jgi:adsorption protein B
MGERFAMVVFHDAEDLVDPAGLGLLDVAIARGTALAQLPVEPIVQRANGFQRRHLGSHYCEEFAESHGKAMVVRDALGAALPAAGVGCAVARASLELLCERADERRVNAHEGDTKTRPMPFDADSLTEDYELGLAVAECGGACRFVRARRKTGALLPPVRCSRHGSKPSCARRPDGFTASRCRAGIGSPGRAARSRYGCAGATGADRLRHWCFRLAMCCWS